MQVNTNPALFINREAIEQNGNLKLPVIYCDKVKTVLERLQRSFENIDLEPSKSTPKQQTSYWQSFSNTCSKIPSCTINTGNTTNINASAFSSVDLSKNVVNNNNTNCNNTNVNSNITSSKTKKEVEEEQKKIKEQADKTNRIILGVTAFVGLLASVYYAGKAMGQLDDVYEDLKDIAVLKDTVKETRLQLTQNRLQQIQISSDMRGKLEAQLNVLDDIVTNEVTSHIAKNAKIRLVLRMAAAVSASFVLIGAIFDVKPLKIVGGLWGVGTVSVMLFNYAHNGSTKKRLTDALNYEINSKIKTILETINLLPKTDMRETAYFVNDPQYQPAYYQQYNVPVFFTNSPENSNYQGSESQGFYHQGSYYQNSPYPTQDNEI